MCFHSWPFDIGQPIGVFFPRKDNLSHPQLSSVFHSSLCRVETSLACLSPIWNDHWYCPCSAHVWVVMWVRLYRCSLWHYQETQSHSKIPDPLSLTISLPFSNVPWVLCVEVFCRCIHWNWAKYLCILVGYGFLFSAQHLWSLMECGFLYFAQHLCISMGCDFLSWPLSFAKWSFLNEGWKLYLFVGIREKNKICC